MRSVKGKTVELPATRKAPDTSAGFTIGNSAAPVARIHSSRATARASVDAWK